MRLRGLRHTLTLRLLQSCKIYRFAHLRAFAQPVLFCAVSQQMLSPSHLLHSVIYPAVTAHKNNSDSEGARGKKTQIVNQRATIQNMRNDVRRGQQLKGQAVIKSKGFQLGSNT